MSRSFFVVGLISCAVAACDGSFFCKYGCLAVVGAETSLVAHEKDLAGGDASSPDGCSVRAELVRLRCASADRLALTAVGGTGQPIL